MTGLTNALPDLVAPTIVGRKDTLQEGAHACALRRMPALYRAWQFLANQWVLTGDDDVVVEDGADQDVSKISLPINGVEGAVMYLSLGPGWRPNQRRDGRDPGRAVVWTAERLKCLERVAGRMVSRGKNERSPPAPKSDRHGASRGGARLRTGGVWRLWWPRVRALAEVLVNPCGSPPFRCLT